MKIKTFVTLLLLSGIALISCSEQPLTEAQKLEKFFMKKNVNILVTDSGLGGLSVAADDLFQRAAAPVIGVQQCRYR